jgi:hypothetical protein
MRASRSFRDRVRHDLVAFQAWGLPMGNKIAVSTGLLADLDTDVES